MKDNKKIEKSVELGGRKLTLSSGELAEQADAAVIGSYGETVVMATVVSSSLKEHPGYFPLTVEYLERLYAGGRIKGSRWVKREGRPSDEEILIARLVDRSIRPLFPNDYRKEVQVIITLLSVDLENTPDVISAIAASAALAISPIPWEGPVATIKVGMKDGACFTNPLESELPYSDMELVVSCTKDSIVMIEATAREIPEEKVAEGIKHAQREGKKVIGFIEEFASEFKVEKERVEKQKLDVALQKRVKELAGDKIDDLVRKLSTRQLGYDAYDEAKKAVEEALSEEENVGEVFDEQFSENVRKLLVSGKRPDGRKLDEIREISSEVGVLPRTHGSAIFKRGQTQVLTVTTLGSPSLEQLIESAEGEETKSYIHHYSMPPYSTGETGRIGYPSRREIGHGALAEKALLPIIPLTDRFPYTIRVVSEILSSNGSTSMASICGSTLSLMDAGVPILSPVAGIAMGIVVKNKDDFVVLSDITGVEDGNGDMDFKVAGTENGITALQLDVKTLELSAEMLRKVLEQAKDGRIYILEQMLKTLPKSREKVSTYAPKIKVVKIGQDKIGELIGPGGKTIRKIIADTGAQVDVEDDGTVNISGISDEGVNEAVKRVEAITKDVVAGEIYEGEVKRIQPFGVFVEILPGKEGMVHVSDMSEGFVKDPADLVRVGNIIKVRVKEIDNIGRIGLSMILSPTSYKRQTKKDYIKRRFSKPRPRKSSGGPHFPTSRLLEQKKSFSR